MSIYLEQLLDSYPASVACPMTFLAAFSTITLVDLVTLQTLNAKVAIEGQPASDVARRYLEDEGFLP